jgi:hypothetical protein
VRIAAVIVLGTLVAGTLSCGADPAIEPSSTGASRPAPDAPSAKASDVPDITPTSASTTTVPTSSTSSTTSIPVVNAPRESSSGG